MSTNSISTNNFSLRSDFSYARARASSAIFSVLQTAQQGLYQTAKIISNIAYAIITSPLSIGISAGLADFTILGLGLGSFINYFLDWAGEVVDPESVSDYSERCFNDPIQTAFVGPVIEEVIFRGFIQGSIKWAAEKILPEMSFSLFGKQVKVATLIAIVVSAVLFGAVHCLNGIGMTQVILCTVGGIFYGVLKERYGLVVPILAHMTNNGMVLLAMHFLD